MRSHLLMFKLIVIEPFFLSPFSSLKAVKKLLMSSWLFIGCLMASWSASAAAEKTLLVYGDSLSAAYGIEINQGWVYLLQQKMQQTNPDWKVVNVSISGETTAGGLSRLQPTLDKYQPDLMLLELGANDGLRGTSLNSTKQNLEKMIQMAQAKKIKTVLFEMQIPPNYGPLYTRKFTQTFQELGKTYNLTVVPFFLDGVAGNSDLNQPDGIHPAAKAQPKLLENVWPTLKPLLN
ncbi:hypothetical protein GZ78_20785 [Endozoicomonas numazuensis]|uniref:SGNH hydrolase-type esterase domain-containing protein n=2 Tax=Endozoicomonas numazuensis TaxID=1137799 RepID=A0A081ND00_9GAMM|nr:hypothetical protein GZ78_20785 [Endozoicomonas numazuensis]